jgi:CubicO group peptidase (beta-lactamase class C family)
MSAHPRMAWPFFLAFLAVCLGSAAAFAEPGKVSDPADLEAFFDGALSVQLESGHIAGAVVSVVAGDKMVFAKGYGYADAPAMRKVDPDKTLFRIGSISKLFTWTAVMQQVEEGKLDLDTDVNKYLRDVQVPATFEQPITLKHLMTHTPGLEDNFLGLFARQPEEGRSLADLFRGQVPRRVRPPGALAGYSNHGTALAGLVVADVTGMSWEDYVEKRILQPLGMEHTLVRQPVKEKMPPEMSRGHKWEGDHFTAHDFEYIPLLAPAGTIGTTGADAAKFMLAYLHDGQLGDKRILRAETVRKMRESLFRPDPKTSSMCYGFFEQRHSGQLVLGHGGATEWFHSLMQLVPEQKVGFFVSFNTDTGAGVAGPLFDAFMQRYFPQTEPTALTPPSDFKQRAAQFAGEYGSTRYSHSTLTKLMALVSVFKVSVNDDDTLTIGLGDNAHRYVEVEPMVVRQVDGTRKFVFQKDDKGRIAYLFPADTAALAAVRHEWYESSGAQLGLLIGCVVVFLTALLFWPVIAFSLRGLTSPNIIRTRFSAALSWIGWLTSAVYLAILVGLGIVLTDVNSIAYGVTPALKGLLLTSQLGAALAGLTVIACVIAWKQRYWRLSGRLHYTLVALAGIGMTWFFYYWNLLTFGLQVAQGNG